VLVSVSVTDAHGRFVTGLRQESFQIFEEKMEQKLSYFSIEDEPVSLGLVLDLSGSMAGKFRRLQEAVGLFLKMPIPRTSSAKWNFETGRNSRWASHERLRRFSTTWR
jgi:Ca-activated chloride channel family protein